MSTDQITTLSAAALRSALLKCEGVISRRDNIPILDNVLLNAPGNGTMTVTATDMENAVTSSLSGVTGGSFTTTIPCATLIAALALDPADEVTIAVGPGGATVRLGDAMIVLPTLPYSDFPARRREAADRSVTLKRDAVLNALLRVRGAISREATRYYLNGVYIKSVGGGLLFESTDGHRLMRETVDQSVSAFPGRIVPRRSIKLLIRLLEASEADPVFEWTDGLIGRVIAGDTELVYAAIDGTWPGTDRVIPADDKIVSTLKAERVDLLRLANGMIGFSESRPSLMQFDLGATNYASSVSDGGAAAQISFVGEWSGPGDLHISYQSRYVVEMLERLTGPVVFRFTADAVNNPTIIECPAIPGWRGVLMPMKV